MTSVSVLPPVYRGCRSVILSIVRNAADRKLTPVSVVTKYSILANEE